MDRYQRKVYKYLLNLKNRSISVLPTTQAPKGLEPTSDFLLALDDLVNKGYAVRHNTRISLTYDGVHKRQIAVHKFFTKTIVAYVAGVLSPILVKIIWNYLQLILSK